MTNKIYQRLSIAILLLFLTSVSFSAQGLEPEEYGPEKVSFFILKDTDTVKYLGDSVNITFVIHSYTNYTMRNVTLTQELPTQLTMLYSQFSTTILTEEEAVNETDTSFDLTLDGSVDTAISDQYYLNQSYLSVHFPSMTNKTKASFWIMVNCTGEGDALFSDGKVGWNDFYTDYKFVIAVSPLSFVIEEEEGIPIEIQYLSGYENDEEGGEMLVIAGLIGVPFIAIFLTPFLYRKK
ncbi:MAG: hypothetical protein ACTSYA_03605 [Candidatus Kariarchaeaceae archaeon]